MALNLTNLFEAVRSHYSGSDDVWFEQAPSHSNLPYLTWYVDDVILGQTMGGTQKVETITYKVAARGTTLSDCYELLDAFTADYDEATLTITGYTTVRNYRKAIETGHRDGVWVAEAVYVLWAEEN